MGNRHASKRRADEELHVIPRKRTCLHAASPFESSGTSRKRKYNHITDDACSRKHESRIPNFLFLPMEKLDSMLRYGFGRSMRERSRSLLDFYPKSDSTDELALSESVQTSNTNIRRKDFPIPWLEALFLPEFPSRSAIGEQNFVISNEIGNGSFGRVYRAIAKNNSRGIYALKIQQKSLILGKNAVQQVRREVAVQYPVGGIGDMFSLWQEHGVLPEPVVQIYGAELACALDFLHRQDVIYRDLKLDNVTLDSAGHVKIVDFGLAKQLKNGEQTNTVCGTLQYMSPDVASEKPYSHNVDFWSLAVLLHILVTGRYPYPNANATHHRQLRFVDYSTPMECSSDLGDLFDKMLTFPANRRIQSFSDLRNHSFFLSINFDDVEAMKYNPLHELLCNGRTSNQSDVIDWNGDDSIEDFEEDYEFDEFNYFNDAI